jgi:pentatricopeptide repeat protein
MSPTIVNSLVNPFDLPTTIEEFNALLHSHAEAGRLVSALRRFRTMEQPEDIVVAIDRPEWSWFGWD